MVDGDNLSPSPARFRSPLSPRASATAPFLKLLVLDNAAVTPVLSFLYIVCVVPMLDRVVRVCLISVWQPAFLQRARGLLSFPVSIDHGRAIPVSYAAIPSLPPFFSVTERL